MNNKIFLILFFIVFIDGVFALSAESENYSVSRFGLGVSAADSNSSNLSSTSIMLANTGLRNSNSELLTANIGFWDNTTFDNAVNILAYSISPSSAVVGSSIGLFISAINANEVWAKITFPNSQTQILTLINGVTVDYLPIPSMVGRYEVIFYANGSFGMISSVVDSFQLTAQPAIIPPTSSPSGGGGIAKTENCTYNWDCSPWSVCIEGKQIRECKNIGTCTDNKNKPSEELNCSESLFDITFKIKNAEVKNNTLKFNISMQEMMSDKKIDVHIKYTIIDSNDNEIFNQIETRAVLKNLTFEKEIDELKLDGEYTLRVDVLYGNLQRAFAEQKFTVKSGDTKKINQTLIIIYLLALIVALLIIALLIKFRKKHKRIIRKKHKKFKLKNLAFIFVISLIAILFLMLINMSITGDVVSTNIESNPLIFVVELCIVATVFIVSLRISGRK